VKVPIIHVIAGHIQDVTPRLHSLALKSRGFHKTTPLKKYIPLPLHDWLPT